ncbi:MAG: DUF4910 domain-containing protein [Nitrospirales bacterium]
MSEKLPQSIEIEQLFRELFPICRSITGDGVRQTLRRLQAIASFIMEEISSGTQVFDWVVPDEWRVREAYVETIDGKRVIDFRDHYLHLVGYSVPFSGELGFDELASHLHTLPDQPDAIPYRTSYYRRDWGFCLSHKTFCQLDPSSRYRVVVNTELFPGSLTLGEAVLPGSSGSEFIVHTYCCHPMMGNDNLSGMVLWALLLRYLGNRPRRHGYRFIIAPETIGTLAYLDLRKNTLDSVIGGFVLTTVAGPGPFSLKESFQKNTWVDRAARSVLADTEKEFLHYPFDVFGSDERQYSSPGFRIPMVTIARSQYHHYPAYHSSLDDLNYISPASLMKSFQVYLDIIDILERDAVVHSLSPFGEPMLGKRGLYPMLGGGLRASGKDDPHQPLHTILWIAFLADGRHSLLNIAEKTGRSFKEVAEIAVQLEEQGLLRLEMPKESLL